METNPGRYIRFYWIRNYVIMDTIQLAQTERASLTVAVAICHMHEACRELQFDLTDVIDFTTSHFL